jgi:cytochrome P450
MIEVTQGQNFVLGMRQDRAYELSYEQLARAFPREDVPTHIGRASAAIAEDILAGKEMQEFDAVEELITAVPTRLCESYFGLQIADADRELFAKCTLAISAYLFGPCTDVTYSALAGAAAENLRKVIRASIANARRQPEPNTALKNLIDMSNEPGSLVTDDVILGQLFGMVMGFIPTNVLAGGNILETLLRRPDFLERARAAAVAGDDDLLWRCLREALRFRHINPGPWRLCPNGYVFGAGGPNPIRIPAGSRVLAIIQSAMFDARRIERPHVFDPERRDEDYMVFGVGQHWCLGAYIAMAQITQTFKPLLKMRLLVAVDNPRVRATRFNNLFPLHLKVRFSA